MTFEAIDAWWWPFLFVLVAGGLATDIWRLLGVHFGGRIREESEALVFARAVATALVAAVIGNLVVFPSGSLADTPMALRIGAAVAGFAVYLATGKRMLPGIVAGEAVLIAGMAAGW
ncbi:AzlD domain-containing protein [Mesorhizobium sp. ASY16-5R]|uniref:AzlD domain-containing protein n=1 Tax=Mesorhizobium sp. ASY16-5R TaxID=3445772 RepID=UPI003FA0175C